MSDDNSQICIRNTTYDDIPKIVELQQVSFPQMAIEGMIWKPYHLESHLHVFAQGQFVAEYDGQIVGSVSSLIVKLDPAYKEHTWAEVCGGPECKNHNATGKDKTHIQLTTNPG